MLLESGNLSAQRLSSPVFSAIPSTAPHLVHVSPPEHVSPNELWKTLDPFGHKGEKQ
jgi:hypothetical protein